MDRKTDQVIKLLELNPVKDKEEIDQIKILPGVGLTSLEIADYLGIPAGAVRVALNCSKNKSGSKKGGMDGE